MNLLLLIPYEVALELVRILCDVKNRRVQIRQRCNQKSLTKPARNLRIKLISKTFANEGI